MTIYYADADRPDNTGNGLSWATAKKTIQAAVGLTTDADYVLCRGVFTAGATLTSGNGTRHLIGCFGATILGTPSQTCFSTYNYGDGLYVRGFQIIGFGIVFHSSVNIYAVRPIYVYDCVIRGCGVVAKAQATGGGGIYSAHIEMYNCYLADNETVATGIGGAGYNVTYALYGCTMHNNVIGLLVDQSTQVLPIMRNCYVHSGRAVKYTSTQTSPDLRWNAFNVANGVDFERNGVVYTTLADWQSASGDDANSVELVGDINDGAKRGGIWPLPGGTCNLLGINGYGEPGGQWGNYGYGIQRSALTLSTNRNASLWNGAVLSNAQIDGNGDIIPVTPGSPWYARTDVIDLGAADDVFAVDVGTVDEDAASPTYQKIRYSNTAFLKTDVSPSWVDYRRMARLSEYLAPTYQYRYWQVEVGQT